MIKDFLLSIVTFIVLLVLLIQPAYASHQNHARATEMPQNQTIGIQLENIYIIIKKTRSAVIRKASRLNKPKSINVSGGCGYRVGYWNDVIEKYCRNKAECAWAKRVMYCESGGNACNYNKSSGASGLFQFLPSTWNAYVKQGICSGSIWDGHSQVRCALTKYRMGGQGIWSCK